MQIQPQDQLIIIFNLIESEVSYRDLRIPISKQTEYFFQRRIFAANHDEGIRCPVQRIKRVIFKKVF